MTSTSSGSAAFGRSPAGLDVSAAFATTLETPEHIRIAEELGYRRAWLYDTPQQSPDVWMCLALAAERTHRIGLGPGVLVPALRHPMVNASGAAALERLAPGRVAVAFGTGYTSRRAMGQQPVSWAYLSRYVKTFRALLRGETAEWEGGPLRMLHTAESLPGTLDTIPVYIGAIGPKGMEIAASLGDGLFVVGGVPEQAREFEKVSYLTLGSVLEDGEPLNSERLRAAAGPGLAQVFHVSYELGGEEAVKALPGGLEWLAVLQETPEGRRHLAVHNGHLLHLNDADTAAWNAGAHTLVEHVTLTGTAGDVLAKVHDLAANGVTEIMYQPAGDIRRELEAFADAVGIRR
ncbi:LLM class flavin-dependent oxidoreductase [Streptomyces sp. ME02-8801-2C]|uniref:LLM class flavin-dependent oxidoreductase n=1 Tax=Streptomyces sp. ME02-8801-2C TaxID=3028680 RepID=UPI0029AF1D20|nr:LLM class flavin-dependent oxidoreductase [Streptomyces sp. ME02-8801-2C]MDX3457114.1 LLM class flavin-dependent oxidoreductase [Streptomyces sp. ME02-8801-2C]